VQPVIDLATDKQPAAHLIPIHSIDTAPVHNKNARQTAENTREPLNLHPAPLLSAEFIYTPGKHKHAPIRPEVTNLCTLTSTTNKNAGVIQAY
jgi:hypothetical protein